MWKPKEVHSGLIPTKCPVCPSKFGGRNPEITFAAHCEECKATYTWHPGQDKPTALLDKYKSQRCGCGSCGR